MLLQGDGLYFEYTLNTYMRLASFAPQHLLGVVALVLETSRPVNVPRLGLEASSGLELSGPIFITFWPPCPFSQKFERSMIFHTGYTQLQ